MKVGSGNLVLEGDKKVKIARAGMQGLALTACKYPVTLGVSLSLDGVGLLSPEGTIARAGQELREDSAAALDSGKFFSPLTWASQNGALIAIRIHAVFFPRRSTIQAY